MWSSFGISGEMQRVICKTVHRDDSLRHLHFRFLPFDQGRQKQPTEASVHDTGRNSINEPRPSCMGPRPAKERNSKAMPRVHKAIVRPGHFEEMRVNYVFRLFSDRVRLGLFMYHEEIQQRHGSVTATDVFIEWFQGLISIMTSPFPAAALCTNSKNAERVPEFLYLDKQERKSEKARTAEGLRVTISSNTQPLRVCDIQTRLQGPDDFMIESRHSGTIARRSEANVRQQ